MLCVADGAVFAEACLLNFLGGALCAHIVARPWRTFQSLALAEAEEREQR